MSIKQRMPTAVILLAVVLVVVQFAPLLLFFLFLQLIILAALLEFYELARKRKLFPHRMLGIFLALLISASFLFPRQFPFSMALVLSLLIFSLYFLLSINTIEKVINFPASAAITFLGPLYIGLPLNFFYHLRLENGPAVIYFLLAVIFLGDTGAYLIGQRFGTHRLVPLASPRKTWEGAVAGLIWAALGALLIRLLIWKALPLGGSVLLGLLTHAAAQIADPVESLFKRAVGVKDSSPLLPGHGGFLDRVDSLLLATPIYYYLLRLFLR